MAMPENATAPARLHLSSHLANSSPSIISQIMAAVAERKRSGHRSPGSARSLSSLNKRGRFT